MKAKGLTCKMRQAFYAVNALLTDTSDRIKKLVEFMGDEAAVVAKKFTRQDLDYVTWALEESPFERDLSVEDNEELESLQKQIKVVSLTADGDFDTRWDELQNLLSTKDLLVVRLQVLGLMRE